MKVKKGKKVDNDLVLVRVNDKISIICKKPDKILWEAVTGVLEKFEKLKDTDKNLEMLRIMINSRDNEALKDVINEVIVEHKQRKV